MKTLSASFAFFLFTVLTVQAQEADAILGVWNNTEKDGRIEIYKEGGEYFGKIIWLKEPTDNGKPKTDENNPDESLQDKPILGLEILEGFTFEDGSWENGTIYDPKNGKTYSCVMTLKDKDILEVRGYIGVSLFGRTVEWTREK
ncbi:DUF2147 domain-containing protein [Algoriphagus formosus]|uniref:DUF2147 domain-containing protein n=1 Tax=Algoriphagus formosus TaxID=2007308 RepID=UPI000C28CB9D|nr:DUF2147 domain-containing protein [Algoriphagus formosus]